MSQSKNRFALSGVFAWAVLFSLASNRLYDWLLAAVVGARPGTVSFITAGPDGLFIHRVATLAASGFLGFAIGAALVGCGRQARVVGRARRYAWLALIAGSSVALSFAVLRMRTAALTGAASDRGIRVALPLDDIPLYPLGVFPGLCVIVYAAALLTRGAPRRDA